VRRALNTRLGRDGGEVRMAPENSGKEPEVKDIPLKPATLAALSLGFVWYFRAGTAPHHPGRQV
jgi:hypothetical protein